MSEKYNKRTAKNKVCLRKQRYVCITIALFVLVTVLIGLFFFLSRKTSFSGLNSTKDDGLMESDLEKFSEEAYESALLSMHSTENFHQEDFAFYRGLETLVASHTILNTKELAQYLDCILTSGNPVSNLYLCLDPELLWSDAHQKEKKWNANLERDLYCYIKENPDISFEIMLPYPYIDYWLNLNSEKLDILLTVYRTFVDQLSAYTNIKIFFPGMEYWLMVNPDNYNDDSMFDANEIITQKLFLYTFCDGVYQITPDNEELFWNALRETIMTEKNASSSYPDLSQWHLVFFGDSVLANYPGSYAIPGYMEGLSNITFDNYAVGGTSAIFYFSDAVNVFLSEKNGKAERPWLSEDKRLCFIFNYGLNDYFMGGIIDNPLDSFDPGTYKGSLRFGISKIQEAYPDAVYIIMTPTHISIFENGTMIMSEEGDELVAYIEAAREISEEMDLYLIDNYDDFIITEENIMEYISDGVHPNEKGRLTIATRIMNFLNDI